MLKLEQQGIKRALVDSQNIAADLLDAAGNPVAMLRAQNIEGFEDHQRKRSLQNVGLFLHGGTKLWVSYRKDGMVPFGKQQEILRDLRCQIQKSYRETAGRLLIEDGVVVNFKWKVGKCLQIQATWT